VISLLDIGTLSVPLEQVKLVISCLTIAIGLHSDIKQTDPGPDMLTGAQRACTCSCDREITADSHIFHSVNEIPHLDTQIKINSSVAHAKRSFDTTTVD